MAANGLRWNVSVDYDSPIAGCHGVHLQSQNFRGGDRRIAVIFEAIQVYIESYRPAKAT